jgi:hypothetical protein
VDFQLAQVALDGIAACGPQSLSPGRRDGAGRLTRYDAAKKVPGRKRHIVTDTLGSLLALAVTAANDRVRDAAASLLMRLRRLHRDINPRVGRRAYTGSLSAGAGTNPP